MRRLKTTFAFGAMLALGSCSGSSSSGPDPNIQARIDILQDCFPELFDKFQSLLDIANTWRVNDNNNPTDPPALMWMERGDGSIQVDYDFDPGVCRLDMQIYFYDRDNVLQDIDLSSATSLAEVVDLAATAIATDAEPRGFLRADWSLRDPDDAIFGAGSFSAIVGGTIANRLVETLYTSLGINNPGGGLPAAAMATVSTITEEAVLCVMRVDMPDLQIDTDPAQQYPIGVVTFTINIGPLGMGALETVATATFDGTNIAAISVADVPTSFTFNIDTLRID